MDAPSPTRRPWRGRLIALALGCLAAAVLAEAGVLLVLGPQVRFPRRVVAAEWGLRTNLPGAEYTHRSADGEWAFRINRQGFRAGADVLLDKPSDVVRVLAVGDSFTAGYEVDEPQCFARRLESTLRQRGHELEVINAGVSGFGTAEEVLYVERELLGYDPDVVVLSFFANDLQDNVRSGLFALEGGQLVPRATSYLPYGRFADFLNRNALLHLLNERSHAFAWAKEAATRGARRRLVKQRRPAEDAGEARAALTAALLDRLYDGLREQGVELVIQSIPRRRRRAPRGLEDVFPRSEFDVNRPGLAFVAMKPILEAEGDVDALYHDRSHNHWTPRAHELSADALAQVVQRALWPRTEEAPLPPEGG